MNNTIQLYIDDDKKIEGYPLTSPDRVIDEKGKSLQQELNEFKEILGNVQEGGGIQGPKGEKGDKGDPGEQGPRGEQGLPGRDGATPDMSNFENKINIQYTAIEKKVNDHIENHPQGGRNGSITIDDSSVSPNKTWSSSKIEDFTLNIVGAIWKEINGGQMVINSTMDGFLREVEILGNTIQNQEVLSDIQHLGVWNEKKQGYEIEIAVSNSSSGDDLNYQEFRTTIVLPCQLMKLGVISDRLYWDIGRERYVIEKNITQKLIDSIKTAPINYIGNNYAYYVNDIKSLDKNFNVGKRDGYLINRFKSIIYSYYNKNSDVWTFDKSGGMDLLIRFPREESFSSIQNTLSYLTENNICIHYQNKTPQLIDTDIREEIKLPTFINNTYVSVNGGIQGSIKAKAPVDGGKVIGMLNSENNELKQMNSELVATSWDIDFRTCAIEWSLEDLGLERDLLLLENKETVSNTPITRYEQAKIMINGGVYKKNTLIKQLSVYLNRGYLTQEEYDELISLMEDKDLVGEEK